MSNHAEAFKLMKYATQDGAEWEIIWNSRDGVTPFCIESRSGKEMMHTEWNNDVHAPPDYKPAVGSRIFVDATEALMRQPAWDYVNKYWNGDGTLMNPGMRDTLQGKSRQWCVDYFLKEWTKPGSPCLVEVQPDGSYKLSRS